MLFNPTFLSANTLIDILSHTKTATAVHVGEQAHIQFANDAMIKIWGKDHSVIGKSLEEALPELKGQPFIDTFAKVWREGITVSGSNTPATLIIAGKEEIVYFDFEYKAILDQNGKTTCILHTAIDVTDRFLKEAAYARAEESRESLGREQALNEELAESNEELAAALEELRATNEELQLTKDALESVNDHLEKRVEERIGEISFLNQELEASNEEIRASNEELYSMNEKLAEHRNMLSASIAELASSEMRTKNIINSAPFPIGVYTGAEMRITFTNKAITDVWGKGDDVVGKCYAEVLPELENQSVYQQLDHVFHTGIPFEARHQRIDLVVDGLLKTFYFNYNFTALREESGKIYGVMNTAADVTDVVLAKQQIEASAYEKEQLNQQLATLNEEMAAVNEELRASNEEMISFNQQLSSLYEELSTSQAELQFAINAAGMATFDLDPRTGRFTGNDLLKFWFGLQPEDDLELSMATDVITDQDRERVISEITRVLEYSSGGDYEIDYSIITTESPEPRILRAKGKTIFDKAQQPIRLSGVIQDVTEQVNAREDITEANTRLRIAIEAGSLGSTEVDLATGKMNCNDQFKRCFGRNVEDDFTYPEMFNAMLPEYRKKIIELVTIAKETHSVYRAEYEISWPDGSIHWISAHGRARYDNDGNAVKMVGIIADITEAKADEQRKNDFIGMVSHELKTPLTSISGYMQLLQHQARKKEDNFSSTALDKANHQLKKMTAMINSFLNVSRLESGKIEVDYQSFDITELINEVQNEFKLTMNSHPILFDHPNPLFVDADKEKMSHVITNLISNAVKYSPFGSEITISCNQLSDRVVVAVKDEGTGIKEEDRVRLFERYFRVNTPNTSISGFGIGLYLCSEIIARHQGEIWVESEFGHGSTFFFSIPIKK